MVPVFHSGVSNFSWRQKTQTAEPKIITYHGPNGFNDTKWPVACSLTVTSPDTEAVGGESRYATALFVLVSLHLAQRNHHKYVSFNVHLGEGWSGICFDCSSCCRRGLLLALVTAWTMLWYPVCPWLCRGSHSVKQKWGKDYYCGGFICGRLTRKRKTVSLPSCGTVEGGFCLAFQCLLQGPQGWAYSSRPPRRIGQLLEVLDEFCLLQTSATIQEDQSGPIGAIATGGFPSRCLNI